MAIFVRVSVHHGNIAAWMRDPASPPTQFVNRSTQLIENLAKIRCPVDKGHLRASISRKIEVRGSAVVGSVGSPLAYAKFVHNGTGIYGPRRQWIYPVRSRFLVFTVRGPVGPQRRGGKAGSNVVFARRVRGIPPSPFLVSALEDVMAGAVIHYH